MDRRPRLRKVGHPSIVLLWVVPATRLDVAAASRGALDHQVRKFLHTHGTGAADGDYSGSGMIGCQPEGSNSVIDVHEILDSPPRAVVKEIYGSDRAGGEFRQH